MRKYVLLPGFVRSSNDGQEHYIGAIQLAELYRVPMDECYIGSMELRDGGPYPSELIRLRPDPTGKYEVPHNGENQ